MRADLFQNVARTTVTIGGRPFQAPVFYSDLAFDGFIFACDAVVAESYLPHPTYALWQLPAGKCLTALMCFEYHETEVEPYNEVALCLPLSAPAPGAMPALLSGIYDLLRGHLHAHILQLPVDTELSLQGGLEHFGYPKFLCDITFGTDNGYRVCRVTDLKTGDHVLTVAHPASGGLALGERALAFCTYPIKEGKILRAQFDLQLDDLSVELVPAHLALDTGRGEMADSARALLHQPLFAFRARKGRGILRIPTGGDL